MGENKQFADSFLFTVMDINKNGELSIEEISKVVKENIVFLNESVLDLNQFSMILPNLVNLNG